MRRYGFRSNADGAYLYMEENSNNSLAIGFNASQNALNLSASGSPGCIPTSPPYMSIIPATGTYAFNSASGTTFSISGTGNLSAPLHTSFLATINSADNNVTGNGATYQLGTNVAFTEIFDKGSNFNTNGTFTAPIDGNYFFSTMILCGGLTILSTSLELRIVTTARAYVQTINPAGLFVSSNATVSFSTVASMTAGDTSRVTLMVNGLAGNTVDIVGSGSQANVVFGGYLLL